MFGTKSALIWCGLLAVLCGFSAYQVAYRWQWQTDILALLPDTESDAAPQSLRQIAFGTVGRSVVFLIGHDQEATAAAATRTLGPWLTASSLFTTVQWDHSHTQQTFFAFYFPFRYQMLSPTLRHLLSTPDAPATLIQRLTSLLYQPTSSLVTPLLAEDPLLFFPALTQEWGQRASHLHLHDGLLSTQYARRAYYVITAQLSVEPFAPEAQEQFEAQWQQWVSALQQTWPNLELTCTSVIRFAAATQKTMSRDIAIISIGSILGVTLLIIGTFQRLRYLALTLFPIGIGIWVAMGVSLWLFGSLHALTLTFGASLIGICDDYSFHYLAHHRVAVPWHAQRTMRHLLPALSFGALTTILSFLGLAFTPLVGLRQIAVFTSCGILASLGTVVFLFPSLLKAEHPHARTPPILYLGTQRIFLLWQRFRRPLFIVYGIVFLLSFPGLFALQVSDSPRALNALPKDLQAQERFIRTVIGLPQNQTHLIIKGQTAEEALQKLEQLTGALDLQDSHPIVELGPVLTSFLPSMKQQKADFLAVQRLLAHRQLLTQELTRLGFPEAALERFFQLIASPPRTFLSPEMWLQHDVSVGLRQLWLGSETGGSAPISLLVQIRRINDLAALQATIRKIGGISYVDQVEDFTRVFKRYRQQAVWLVSGAYLLIGIIVVWYYRRQGILVMLPPVLAAIVTVSVFGYLGHPFHLIHMLMLLLVLGMGVDFTIFIVESAPQDAPTTLLAMTLSTLSTLLSFGLLSLSSQAVLQAIGLTVLIGLATALFLAPLAYYGQTSS